MPTSEEVLINFKVVYKDEIRRFQIPSQQTQQQAHMRTVASFPIILHELKRIYGLSDDDFRPLDAPSNSHLNLLSIYYKDFDGDLVRIGSQFEMKHCLRDAHEQAMRDKKRTCVRLVLKTSNLPPVSNNHQIDHLNAASSSTYPLGNAATSSNQLIDHATASSNHTSIGDDECTSVTSEGSDGPPAIISARKAERLVQRQRRKMGRGVLVVDDIDLAQCTAWPTAFKKLVFDGNNMFFLASGLRKLATKNRLTECEQLLHTATERFHVIFQLQQTVLYLDHTELVKQVVHKCDTVFQVLSATPQYKTADDAICSMVEKCCSEEIEAILVCTSDIGLRKRLKEYGAPVIAPKHWLAFYYKNYPVSLSKQYKNVNKWFDGEFNGSKL